MEYLTVSDAAKELKLAETTLRHYCQQGRIGEKIGRQWLISRADLERFKATPRPVGRPRLDGQTPGNRAG